MIRKCPLSEQNLFISLAEHAKWNHILALHPKAVIYGTEGTGAMGTV